MPIKPKLRFFDLTMIVVSMVIGIGIFRNPSVIAQGAGSQTIFFLAWIVGALVSICGALTFAEIGSRFPVAGGYYKLFSLCYHPAPAFMLIWTYILLNAGSTAVVAFTGAQYIAPVILPSTFDDATGEKLMFFAIIFVLFFLNYLGIKMGARTQNLLSIVKIVLMLILISVIFFAPSADSSVTTETSSTTSTNSSAEFFKALGVSLIAVFFTYGGYQNTANLGGDVQSPQRSMPRAILGGMAIVFVLYLLINIVYVNVLGFDTVQNSPLIAADLAKVLFGPAGAAFASIAIFISVLGFCNTEFLHNPRVMYAMSEEQILPKIFMKLNAKKQVQEFALTFYTLLIIIMFLLLQTYNNLLNYVMFNDTISLACAAFCVFILRKKKTGDEIPGFRLRWFPVIPIIFIAMQLIVTGNVINTDPKNSLIGFLVMISGLPLYFILKYLARKNATIVHTE